MSSPKLRDFLAVVFDPGEMTCFTDTPKGTSVHPIESVPDGAAFFTINPLHPTDLNPTEDYHHPDRPRRADANVSAYRTILLEFDKMPVSEQVAFIEASGIPYSAITFSGSKSMHVLLVLKEPLSSRKDYDALVARVYRVFQADIDPANKNPSRLSRLPEAFRAEKGQTQTLIALKSRVPLEDLESWLVSKGSLEREERVRTVSMSGSQSSSYGYSKRPNGFTNLFLMGSYEEGTFNRSLFMAAIDLANCGYALQEIIEKCEGVTGTLDRTDLSTIRSAFKRASLSEE